MPNPTRKRADIALIEQLCAVGDGVIGTEEKAILAQSLRAKDPETSQALDHALFGRIETQADALCQARDTIEKQHALLKKHTSAPWIPATFLGAIPIGEGQRALVATGNSRRLVEVVDGIKTDELGFGEDVFLGEQGNVIMGRATLPTFGGEIATLERHLPDGRLVLKAQDHEIVTRARCELANDSSLTAGDLIRFDRQLGVAFEKVPAAKDNGWLKSNADGLELTRDSIGGQKECVQRLLGALTMTLVDPEMAARYGLHGRKSILMHGPPGCGKTMMARLAVAEIQRLSGKRCRFVIVKPAEWESEFVGVAERNIRKFGEDIRNAAAADGFVVVFIDELEAVGRVRGGSHSTHHDRFLAALLVEWDGFSALGNVAFISATNRKDLLDPALLERAAATEIRVPRPNLATAKAILGIHLGTETPFSPNGAAASATREELIERAVSRLYSPQADNMVCVVRFRDAKERKVAAAELVSGRLLQQICLEARRLAFDRDARTGDAGVRVADMEAALEHAIERLRTTLSPRNIHAYLDDLPQDIAVVAVDPVKPKIKRAHRYLNA